MNTLVVRADERVKDVTFTDETIAVELMDGRSIIVPLMWYPRLFNATPEQRSQWELCGGGYGRSSVVSQQFQIHSSTDNPPANKIAGYERKQLRSSENQNIFRSFSPGGTCISSTQFIRVRSVSS